MKITKYVVLFLSVMFVAIVLIEQIPGVLVPIAGSTTDFLMFGLFKISLLDDITHLLSGLVGFYTLFRGYRMQVRYLAIFGSYYALDATFYILYGLVSHQPLIDNFLLNVPHVAIA